MTDEITASFRQILTDLGGDPLYGDTLHALLRKIVVAMGGSEATYPFTVEALLREILTLADGTPLYQDGMHALLRKVLEVIGGSPTYNQTEPQLAAGIVLIGLGTPAEPGIFLTTEDGVTLTTEDDVEFITEV